MRAAGARCVSLTDVLHSATENANHRALCPILEENIVKSIPVLVILYLIAATAVAAPRVENGAEPRDGTAHLTLEPLWTVGGGDDDSLLLGVIEQVIVDDENRIYLLDTQLATIQILDVEGNVLGNRGAPGDGPGEVRRPVAMTRFPDGVLGLAQSFPGKLVLLDADGTPAGSITPQQGPEDKGNFLRLDIARPAGENVVLGGTFMTMDGQLVEQELRPSIRLYDRQGNRIAEYAAKTYPFNMRTMVVRDQHEDFVWNRMDAAPDGRFAVSIPRNGYEVTVFDAEGAASLVFTRAYEPWWRNDEALDRERRILKALYAMMNPDLPVEVEPTAPDVVDLLFLADGRIWTQTSRARWEPAAGSFTEYDEFDGAGMYTRVIRVACDGDAKRDRLIFSQDGSLAFRVAGYWDAVLGVQDDGSGVEAEPMAVTCYQVVGR